MLDFSKLRLSSFKSFVEPIEIDIKDGLTGVVGPNGCGKSKFKQGHRALVIGAGPIGLATLQYLMFWKEYILKWHMNQY